MTYMLHALYRAEGFIMITGRPGTGKTTLISDLTGTLKPNDTLVAKIVSTQLTANDLLELVAYSFNIDPEGCSKAKVLVQVERLLKQQYQLGRRALLIVDEAQDMGEDALEELRLLTNIQIDNQQLLQVFLVGQEQLRETVNKQALEQLHQRLIATAHLEPLDTDDTKAYIKHRLRCVNWKGDPAISTEAFALIQRYSQGIPRQINQICSRLFLYGYLEKKHRFGIADLKIIVEELQQESLLPIGKEGIDEATQWPAEHHGETYEEEPQANPPAPATADPTRHPLQDTERAGQKPPTMAADTRPRPPPATESISVAKPGPRENNHHKRAIPASSIGTRRLRSRTLLGLSLLLAGLALALAYTTNAQFTRLSDRNPHASEHSGRQAAASLTPGNASQRMTATDNDMRTGLVIRESLPGSHYPKRDVSQNETELLEQEQATGSMAAKALRLEERLQQNSLLAERLNNDLLKVNLDSDRLFDFDTAQFKDGARPVLQKLTEVLRNYDDLTLEITGHTDSSGPAKDNLHLPQLRVRAVTDYLIDQGLAESSIQSQVRGDDDTSPEPLTGSNPGLKGSIEIYIRLAEEK